MFTLKCDLFIVPNPIMKKSDFADDKDAFSMLCMIDGINGIPRNSEYVNCLLRNEESEDMGMYGFRLPNGDYVVDDTLLINFVPMFLLQGHKEGDIINYKVIVNGDRIVNLKCRLAQQEYRYSHFGNFEDALKTVIERGEIW